MTDGPSPTPPPAPGARNWFQEPPHPFRLLASRCTTCGSLTFPPRAIPGCPDPDCQGMEHEPTPLSPDGTLWSYTDARYAPPPPYPRRPDAEFEPYLLAAVELAAEKMIILGQVVPGVTADTLAVGMPMRLVPGVLTSSEGVDERVWHWEPR